MKAYADTSFLLSVYIKDVNSKAATAFMKRWREPLPFTPLHRHEIRNAIRLTVFRKQITTHQRDGVLQQIEDDLESGILVSVPLAWSDTLKKAENLSATYTETLGNRGMDVLHVASALTLATTRFLTFDGRQEKLADQAGLKLDR